MQAIGDIILYFSPCPNIILIITLKRVQKIQLGENFPPVSLFFPLRPCKNCSTFTDGVLGGKMAIGKLNHIFPAGHNLFLCQYLRISWVGNYDIYFFILGHVVFGCIITVFSVQV
jgi:hypothetical protein